MSDMTATVRKLLDKAQATEFAEEAEAFMAKAQELMAKHGIERAALEAAGTVQSDEITFTEVTFEAPYALPKSTIGSQVGRAFGLKAIYVSSYRAGGGKGSKTLMFHGTKSNIEKFESMLETVLFHATVELVKAECPAHENTRSFRGAFLEGYASTIGSILTRANRKAKEEATVNLTEDESKGVALVLVGEKERIEEAFTKAHPNVRRTYRSGYSSGSGNRSGSGAAGRFTGHQGQVGGSRGALNR